MIKMAWNVLKEAQTTFNFATHVSYRLIISFNGIIK